MSIESELLQRIQTLEARIRSLERVELPVAGSGGFAPSDAQYLTLAASGGLSQERIFTPSAPLSGADSGAGAAYTLSITSAALTKTDDTNITLTLGGSPTSALLAATSLTLGWTGQLAVTRGGTGLGGVAQGDLLYGSAANTLSALAKNTSATRYLSNTGASNNPAWAQIDLSNGVTGILPIANGGTGASSLAAAGIVTGSLTSGRVPYATGATTLADSAAMTFATSGNLLTLTAQAATDTPLKVVPHASQSVDLATFNNAAGTNYTGVTSAGVLYATSYANTANIQLNRFDGSFASPSQVATNVPAGTISFRGADNSGTPALINLAQLRGYTIDPPTTTTRNFRLVGVFFDDSGNAQLEVSLYRSRVLELARAASPRTLSGNNQLIIGSSTAPSGSGYLDASSFFTKDRWGTAGDNWPHIYTENSGTIRALIGESSADVVNTTTYTVTVSGNTILPNAPYMQGVNAAATSATTGTMTTTMTSAAQTVFTITPTGNCTFNASGGVAGARMVFYITTSGTTSYTLTWGTNYKTTGTLATGTVSGAVFTVAFVCKNGTEWAETCRTTAM